MTRFRKALRSLHRDDGLGGSRHLAPAAHALIGPHAQDGAIVHQPIDKKRNAFKLVVIIFRSGRATDRIMAVKIDDGIGRSKGDFLVCPPRFVKCLTSIFWQVAAA